MKGRAEEARLHLQSCRLCPHLCGDLRRTGQGRCRVGEQSYIASEMLHMGEESLLSPAHAIFFSGCTAICSFCTAARFAFRPQYGVPGRAEPLAQRILQRQAEGARSLCFIGGDPVPHIPLILETLANLGDRRTIPAVFNSNFYLTQEALDLLAGAIDIYLPDLKFGPGPCGERIGGMPDYWEVVTTAIYGLYRQGERVVVRHLIMPGHYRCCTRPVLEWLSHLPGIEVSLLDQYLPSPHAVAELRGFPSSEQVNQSLSLSRELGLNLID